MEYRLQELRKKLGLSMEEFGKRLGVTRSSISKLEAGKVKFTDQMIKGIVREFNVNYDWLVYGEGEMFNQTDRRAYAIIDEILNGQNEFAKQVFMSFANFDKRDWQTLEKLIDNIISMREKDKKKQEPDS